MAREISGDALRGHLETMLLSVLERGPAHGFEILKRLEAAGCGLLKLREGSVYPALYRLEESGLVSARWDDTSAERLGPRRRVYRLSKKGQQRLMEGREDWSQFVSVIGGIMGATT